MAFRDDRDAQLHRADALERENARLREKLAARDAADRERTEDAAVRSRAVVAAHRSVETLDRENAELRAELARARGPGLLRRIAARVASLHLAEPESDGRFVRGALVCWRLHVPVLIGIAIPAAVAGGHRAWALAAVALGAPVVAAVALLVPWLLGRRGAVTAGWVTGAVIGIGMSAAIAGPLITERSFPILALVAGVSTVLVLLFVTRALLREDVDASVGPLVGLYAALMMLPHPLHVLMWFGFGLLGARLADGSRWSADR